MMATHETDEFSAAFDKLCSDFLRSWVAVQGEHQKSLNPLNAMEFRDLHLDLRLAERFPIKVQNTAFDVKISFIKLRSSFSEIIDKVFWTACSLAFSIHHLV